MKSLLINVVFILSIPIAQADTFQYEVGLGYLQGDSISREIAFDTDTMSGFGSLYFEAVNQDAGPLAESAFLQKSSSVSIAYSTTDFVNATRTFNNVTRDLGDFGDQEMTSIDLLWITQEDYILAAGYEADDQTIDAPGFEYLDQATDNTKTLGFGKYLDESTTVVLSFSTVDKADVDTVGVSWRQLRSSMGGDYNWGYDTGVSFINEADGDGYGVSLGATYYVSRMLGFNAGVNFEKTDSAETTELLVAANYFFTPRLAFGLIYGTSDVDIKPRTPGLEQGDNIEVELYGASLTVRF